jgi:hypothetical protein
MRPLFCVSFCIAGRGEVWRGGGGVEGDSNHNLTADIVICQAAPPLDSLKTAYLKVQRKLHFLNRCLLACKYRNSKGKKARKPARNTFISFK